MSNVIMVEIFAWSRLNILLKKVE